MKGVFDIICKRKPFYQKKMGHFLSWTNSKSGMNGATEKYIRNMLSQILKELMIPGTSVNHVISCVYTYDYDASRLINLVKKNVSTIYDLFNKDKQVVKESIDATIFALHTLHVHTMTMSDIQKAGLCVFTQLIFHGARTEFEGFGTSEDLIKTWKKFENMKKIKENERLEKERKEKEKKLFEEERDKYEKKKKEDEIFKQTDEEIPDSWED
tara:strand:- start:11378 stop:12013 length:636 start_codon:yes stop_codon:yes gene_type:complete